MAELATTLESTDADRLDQAEGIVRAYCGWHIAPSKDVAETLPTSSGVLILRSLHVTAVASVTLTDGTVLDPGQYEWTGGGVLRLRPDSYATWSAQPDATVAYTSGYATPPPEVTGVVRAVGQRAASNPRAVLQQTTGPFGVTYSAANGQALALTLLDSERVVLDYYRLAPRP